MQFLYGVHANAGFAVYYAFRKVLLLGSAETVKIFFSLLAIKPYQNFVLVIYKFY